MKIEHKLSPAMAGAVNRILEQLRAAEDQRLIALGRAKESELAMATLRLALSEQLAVVQQTEGLPVPLAPYQLSPDGAALVGEVADPPAAAAAAIAAPAEGPRPVNGAAHAR